MYDRKILFIVLTAFCITNFSFRCNKGLGCAESVYNFELGIVARPDFENINIGDTVWLNINEAVNLKDVGTGRIVDYGDAANLGSAISFHKLSDLGQFTIQAAEQFDFKLINGTEINNADPKYLREYLFEQRTNYYIFKLGIIPKEKGIYGLIFSNAANVYRKNDKCTKANFTLSFKDTDQHYHLNPNFQGGPIPVGSDYYFQVY